MTLRIFKKRNKGSTLIEMIVCFALLGIFMSAAAVVISNVTNIYYDVKGQSYGRQVADLLLSKITGEIEGAKLAGDNKYTHPVIYQDPADALAGNRSGYKIDLYDRTDTHIQIYAEDGLIKIRYFEINPPKEDSTEEYRKNHRDEVIWTFDDAVYMGYVVKSLRFVPANQGTGTSDSETLENAAYDQQTVGENDYPGNVVGVYLTLESSQYGEFYAYRYVKMHDMTDKEAQGYNISLLTATEYN